MTSPFASLIERKPVNIGRWPEHARRTHTVEVPSDRYPDQDFEEFVAGDYRKVRIRAQKIAAFIRERKQATAHELVHHAGVARRTVYRDIQLLKEVGAPINGCPEHGYRWQEGEKE